MPFHELLFVCFELFHALLMHESFPLVIVIPKVVGSLGLA